MTVKISRTEEERKAIESIDTNSAKVLKVLFSENWSFKTPEISRQSGLSLKTVQATIYYIVNNEQADIVIMRKGRNSEYLLTGVNPEKLREVVRHKYTDEKGNTFIGLNSIARHLKVSQSTLKHQMNDLGKTLDESILYLKTIGVISRKDTGGMVFVKKAMNCPMPSFFSDLTPAAK